MPAYLIVQINVENTDWVEDYVANVPAIFRKYGGEYLAVSQTVKQFEGEGKTPDQVAIFTFPSLEAIEKFMNSEEYMPFKEARTAASTATVVGLEPRQ